MVVVVAGSFDGVVDIARPFDDLRDDVYPIAVFEERRRITSEVHVAVKRPRHAHDQVYDHHYVDGLRTVKQKHKRGVLPEWSTPRLSFGGSGLI
ncbi:MAG TPA: hypothetical protein VJR89_36520 [Polyangiales bacterium]|nr:hypothetical protein [Polyangiales bacterium]